VWIGTVIIVASIAFTLFVLYALLIRRMIRSYLKFIVVLGGWIALFAVQLAYLSAHSVIVYGVYYDEADGTYLYSMTRNPMAVSVAAVTIATAIVVNASLLVSHLYEVYGEIYRRMYRIYYSA
jgi:phosphoribosylcarboxyaminoimidazole (NCAIR) mutase